MNISKAGIDLIKKYEGCRLTAYKPVANEPYYTIGWGHYGKDVAPGMKITQNQADSMLTTDLKVYESYVNAKTYVPIPLNQNQFDALVSFCYNCGAGNLKKLCANRTHEQIANAMQYYRHSVDGKVLAGLVRRRREEISLLNAKP